MHAIRETAAKEVGREIYTVTFTEMWKVAYKAVPGACLTASSGGR